MNGWEHLVKYSPTTEETERFRDEYKRIVDKQGLTTPFTGGTK
jgi:hypothetical protein